MPLSSIRFNSATVWLGTKNSGGLYKSTDCGATFTLASTGANGALMGSGEMVSMQVDPIAPGVIYATSWTGAEGVGSRRTEASIGRDFPHAGTRERGERNK